MKTIELDDLITSGFEINVTDIISLQAFDVRDNVRIGVMWQGDWRHKPLDKHNEHLIVLDDTENSVHYVEGVLHHLRYKGQKIKTTRVEGSHPKQCVDYGYFQVVGFEEEK